MSIPDFRSVLRVFMIMCVFIVGTTVFTNRPHESWETTRQILGLMEEAVQTGTAQYQIVPNLIDRTVINPLIAEFGGTLMPKAETKPAKPVDPKQLDCVATAIWHEARSESITGQAAVAWVILNRVRMGFARTPCSVVYQTHTVYNAERDEHVKSCQFSWHCDPEVGRPNPNSHAYKRIINLAHDVMAHNAYENVIPPTTVFFHSKRVNPKWRYHQVATIGNHVFYSRRPPRKQDV